MPVRLSLAALGLVLVAALPAAAKEKIKAPEPEAFSCSGLFAPNTTEARLRAELGDDNVETGTVYGAEGMEYRGTTLYPGDPPRSMQIIWYDEENLAYPSLIYLAESQTAPGGVRIGMTIAEVEALNGQSFALGGFWWDYGGYAYFIRGALSQPDPDCHLSVRFSPDDNVLDDVDVTPVSGDVELTSDMPLLTEIDTRVTGISVGYEWPEALPQEEY